MSRFLADENFPRRAVLDLRNAGHDVFWAKCESPGVSDEKLLTQAVTEQRVLVTFDKDFGELAFRHGLAAECGIVLFRLSMKPPGPAISQVVATLQSRDDWAGHFSVVEAHQIRMRKLHLGQ